MRRIEQTQRYRLAHSRRIEANRLDQMRELCQLNCARCRVCRCQASSEPKIKVCLCKGAMLRHAIRCNLKLKLKLMPLAVCCDGAERAAQGTDPRGIPLAETVCCRPSHMGIHLNRHRQISKRIVNLNFK